MKPITGPGPHSSGTRALDTYTLTLMRYQVDVERAGQRPPQRCAWLSACRAARVCRFQALAIYFTSIHILIHSKESVLLVMWAYIHTLLHSKESVLLVTG